MGFNHIEKFEQLQISFFNKLLKLPWNTPNKAIRVELNVLPLTYDVLKSIHLV